MKEDQSNENILLIIHKTSLTIYNPDAVVLGDDMKQILIIDK